MEKWVINGLLTEEMVLILEKEKLLKPLADCSRQLVIDSIILYLNSNGDEDVKDALREAYKDRINIKEILCDESIALAISEASTITLESVHAGLTVEQLKDMRRIINLVHNSDVGVPYINPISGDLIAEVINSIAALYRVNKNPTYKKFGFILSKNKELFKDKPNTSARGTIFKSVNKRGREFDIILKGINFLLERKNSGVQPDSWRMF